MIAGGDVPEDIISDTLQRKKSPFHGVRTLRLIEQRSYLREYSTEWSAMCKKINRSSRSDRRRAKRRALGVADWKQLRSATRKFPPQIRTLKDNEGNKVPLTEVADSMAQHYATKQWEAPTEKYIPQTGATYWPEVEEDINVEFVEDELQNAAKMLKKNRSAKPTGIANEMIVIMLAVQTFRDSLLNMFNSMFNHGILPTLWLLAIVLAIYKKGSRFLPETYRPISLVDTMGKQFVRMLTSRIARAVEKRLGRTRYGFRKGWSGLANFPYILQLAEQAQELAEEALIIIFLDLKMCFDRIRIEELEHALDRIGIRGKMLKAMKLHQDLKCRVQVGEYTSREHVRGRGLRQGDPAASILCIMALALVYSDAKGDVESHDDEEVREQNRTDPIKFKAALYAGDAAIPGLSSKLKRLQAYTDSILRNLHRGGSEENRKKTKYVVITGAPKLIGNRKLSLVKHKRARLAAIRRVRQKGKENNEDEEEGVAKYLAMHPEQVTYADIDGESDALPANLQRKIFPW